MSLLRPRENRALPTNIDPYGITARPPYQNFSGVFVSERTAFASSAVLACTSIIADSIASMPLELFQKSRSGKVKQLETPSLLLQPNPKQSQFDFTHQAVGTLALHGCDAIYAPRINAGELPPEMWVLHPNHFKDEWVGDKIVYKMGKEIVPDEHIRVMHWMILAGMRRGISPLDSQRNTIGMGIAMDRFLAQFYSEGGTPSSVLETEQKVTPDTAKVMRDTWETVHVQRRRPAVLGNGLKWRSIVTSAADMQMLEHREAVIRDISRVYRIPLNLINGTGGDSQTYQNVESMSINFVRFTLLPWMRRFEDAISGLLPITQYVRFNTDEFMRGDMMTRTQVQQLQIMMGALSPNEAREDDDRAPYAGGDQFVLALPAAPMAGIKGGDLPVIGTSKNGTKK